MFDAIVALQKDMVGKNKNKGAFPPKYEEEKYKDKDKEAKAEDEATEEVAEEEAEAEVVEASEETFENVESSEATLVEASQEEDKLESTRASVAEWLTENVLSSK